MITSGNRQHSHDEAFELIPWLVNGRLSSSEQQWLERHVAECDECRREVESQQRLRRAIRREESNVEYAPHASFRKLMSRIDASGQDSLLDEEIDRSVDRNSKIDEPAAENRRAASSSQRWMLAASILLSIGLGLVLASSWRSQSSDPAAVYSTASSPQAAPNREGQIRAVFSPNVTVDELSRIVGETRLTIVDGPSDSGVYTLALQPSQNLRVADALARLRRDPRVRFAEPVVAESPARP